MLHNPDLVPLFALVTVVSMVYAMVNALDLVLTARLSTEERAFRFWGFVLPVVAVAAMWIGATC